MRILAFNWRDLAHERAGGAEVYLQSVAGEWTAMGHEVTIFCAAVPGRPASEVVDGVRIVRRGSRLGVYREARRFYEREGRGRFDLVVESVNTRPFLTPRYVHDVPVVAVIHQLACEIWEYETPWPVSYVGRHLLEPRWLRCYRNVPVATSSESSRASFEEIGLRSVTVVPEGWTPHGRPSGVQREAAPTVVFVGRLSPNKRPDDAVRAFDLLRRVDAENGGALAKAQMWVMGSGPMNRRLERRPIAGVSLLGRVPEDEKRDRLARAHVLVATSVREGWGLVVTEAAAVGTPTIAYDVPGLRDSVRASGGVLVEPSPSALAAALAAHVPVWCAAAELDGRMPGVAPGGVVPWSEVARRLLEVAGEDRVTPARAARPAAPGVKRRMRQAAAWSAWLGVAGIVELGALGGRGPSAAVADGTFAVLLASVCLGLAALQRRRRDEAISSSPSAPPRMRQRPRSVRMSTSRPHRTSVSGERGADTEHGRGGGLGALAVALVAIGVAQSWFVGGAAIAGGDLAPPYGLAWVHRLFSPWVWNGSNLGGPGALEGQAPWAGVLLAVHMLGGGAGLAQRIWITALFAGAGLAAYWLGRILGLPSVGATVGACAYLFNGYTLAAVGINPVFIAAMVLVAAYPALVLTVATRRWRLRTGVACLVASAPLLGYSYQNPPLVLLAAGAFAGGVLGSWWLYGAPALRQVARLLGIGVPLLLAACAYWILPSWLQLQAAPTSTLAAQSSWSWTEGRANLGNALWLNTAWGWQYPLYYSYAPLYQMFPLNVAKFLEPALAWAALGLAARRRSRDGRLRVALGAALVALTAIFISTGTNAPGSMVFNLLYRLPEGWLLREPGRFLMAAGLAYGVLVGTAATAIVERLPSWRTSGAHVVRVAFAPRAVRFVAGALALGMIVFGSLTAPGFPLATGAVVPGRRSSFPADHVTLPRYWQEATNYLNSRKRNATVLVLPPDDFYQMPYRWYYGNDAFIVDLLDAHVIDPSGQGYFPGSSELLRMTHDAAASFVAGDWPLAERLVEGLGATEILVRGDVVSSFPGRSIMSPAALASALKRDPYMRLLHRFGPLSVFEVRSTFSSDRVVMVDARAPDPRLLSLFPLGTSLVTGPPLPGLAEVFEAPPLARWKQVGGKLQTTVPVGGATGWRRAFAQLAPVAARAAVREPPAHRLWNPYRASVVRVGSTEFIHLSVALGPNVVRDGSFRGGRWGPVGNCDAVPGTTASAHLRARVQPHGGPLKLPALELSAAADRACESQVTLWRKGPVLLSLWSRTVRGAAPALCLWEEPIGRCAPSAQLSAGGRWHHFQEVITPQAGTRKLVLYLYATLYGSGTDEFAAVQLRPLETNAVPVVVGYPTGGTSHRVDLVTSENGTAAGWIGPRAARHVVVDGLRNGWLVRAPSAAGDAAAIHYVPASWGGWMGLLSASAGGIALLGLLGSLVERLLKAVVAKRSGAGPLRLAGRGG